MTPLKLIQIKPCKCGEGEWVQWHNFEDLVHCSSCGEVHFINVQNPVAKAEHWYLK